MPPALLDHLAEQTRTDPGPRPIEPVLHLRLIGPMEAWSSDGKDVTPASPRARALLAIVALSSPRPVMRAWVADLLWSHQESESRALLRQEVHRLTDALGPVADVLVATRDQLSLRPGAVWIDAHEVRDATVERPAALSLLDHELLEDLDEIDPALDHWLTLARERLRDGARGVAEAVLLRRTAPSAIIPAAWRLLRIDGTHEGAWRSLMRAHGDMGRIALANQAYGMCRAALARQRDTAPSADTEALLRDLAARDAEDQTEAPEAVDARSMPRDGPTLGVAPMRIVGAALDDLSFEPCLMGKLAVLLARYRWMIAFPSDASGRPMDHASGVPERADFVIEGSIARAGGILRVTFRLLETKAADRVLWAHRFDVDPNNSADSPFRVAARAAARIEREMFLVVSRRATEAPRADATAYELMVHSFPAMQRLEPAGFARAGGWLTQAMAREPEYVPVCFIYALWQVLAIGQGWAEDEADARARAEDAVNRGIALSPNSARGHAVAGLVKAKAGRASAEAMDLFDRALRCNPDLPMAWGFSAMACVWLGDFDEAARRHAEYLAILPRNMFGFLADAEIGTSLLLRGDNEAAASFGRARSLTVPLFSDGYKPWLSALGHLGQTREAETVLDRLLRIEPAFSVSRFLATTPLQNTGHREHFAEGLRRAGLR